MSTSAARLVEDGDLNIYFTYAYASCSELDILYICLCCTTYRLS